MSRITFAVMAMTSVLLAMAGFARAEGLVVHEWGTFTSLQDESGNAIGGINADDEPVPGFVHGLNGSDIISADHVRDPRSLLFAKGVAASHPDVTMRLETPVIYFHAPAGAGPMPVDVSVTFRGGWLSQYFPFASAAIDGKRYDPMKNVGRERIVGATEGTLAWEQLLVGTDGKGPETAERVWLAPRAVPAAAMVTAAAVPELKIAAESERFLFYRGVGHLDSPLRVRRAAGTLQLDAGPIAGPAWLVDIRADGRSAFRQMELNGKPATALATFGESEYRSDTSELRTAMRGSLISDGLFPDEADAMLNTWEVSYFKNAGTRVFFLVPRAWTDGVLPLSIASGGKPVLAERIVRTMVGRMELVTPAQRELLKVVANPPGRPEQVIAYKALGRFRDALVIGERQRKPTASLTKLITEQRIGPVNLSKVAQPDVSSGG